MLVSRQVNVPIVVKVPATGSRVQIRTGHAVTYDLNSDVAIRAIHVAGTLSFARNKTTRLDVGLLQSILADDSVCDFGLDVFDGL